jgi:hypothetical protein
VLVYSAWSTKEAWLVAQVNGRMTSFPRGMEFSGLVKVCKPLSKQSDTSCATSPKASRRSPRVAMIPEYSKLPPHFYSKVSSTLFHTLFLSISFFHFHQSINSLELLIHFRPHPDCVWIKITGLCLIASSSTTTSDKSPGDGTYTHPSWVTLLLVVLASCTIAVTPSIFSHRNETVSSCADSCASSDCRRGLDLDSACFAFDRAESLP